MDTKIQKILEARGQWNADGISRKAAARLCPLCRRPMMVGLDADTAAFTAKCSPEPLNATGELLALMAGLRTYSISWLGNAYVIDFRDVDRIKWSPPGSNSRDDVLAEHRCDFVTTKQMTITRNAIPPVYETGVSDDAPF